MDLSGLERKVAENPGSPVFARLADAYLDAGRNADARRVLDAGLDRYPNYYTGFIVYAKYLIAEGRFAEAQDIILHLSARSPEYPMLRTLLNRCMEAQQAPAAEPATPEPAPDSGHHVEESLPGPAEKNDLPDPPSPSPELPLVADSAPGVRVAEEPSSGAAKEIADAGQQIPPTVEASEAEYSSDVPNAPSPSESSESFPQPFGGAVEQAVDPAFDSGFEQSSAVVFDEQSIAPTGIPPFLPEISDTNLPAEDTNSSWVTPPETAIQETPEIVPAPFEPPVPQVMPPVEPVFPDPFVTQPASPREDPFGLDAAPAVDEAWKMPETTSSFSPEGFSEKPEDAVFPEPVGVVVSTDDQNLVWPPLPPSFETGESLNDFGASEDSPASPTPLVAEESAFPTMADASVELDPDPAMAAVEPEPGVTEPAPLEQVAAAEEPIQERDDISGSTLTREEIFGETALEPAIEKPAMDTPSVPEDSNVFSTVEQGVDAFAEIPGTEPAPTDSAPAEEITNAFDANDAFGLPAEQSPKSSEVPSAAAVPIKPVDEQSGDLSPALVDGRIVSKTLAEIYVAQGVYEEAITTYKLLKKQRPRQAAEWDKRIEELERKIAARDEANQKNR